MIGLPETGNTMRTCVPIPPIFGCQAAGTGMPEPPERIASTGRFGAASRERFVWSRRYAAGVGGVRGLLITVLGDYVCPARQPAPTSAFIDVMNRLGVRRSSGSARPSRNGTVGGSSWWREPRRPTVRAGTWCARDCAGRASAAWRRAFGSVATPTASSRPSSCCRKLGCRRTPRSSFRSTWPAATCRPWYGRRGISTRSSGSTRHRQHRRRDQLRGQQTERPRR
jgi:hypothetical protein